MPTRKNSTHNKEKFEYKKIYRSETDKVVAGVAGGLGEYFGVDPSIIRLIFILITVFGGSGLIIYIVLWIVLPSESKAEIKMSEDVIRGNVQEMKNKAHEFADRFRKGRVETRKERSSWFGIFLVVLGVAFLFANLGYFSWFSFDKFWPFIIIILGLLIVFKE